MKELQEYLESKNYHNSVTNAKHLLSKFPDLKNYLLEDKNLNFSGQLFCIINNIDYPICPHCNTPHKFISFKKGFVQTCSNNCHTHLVQEQNITYKKENGKILVCEKHQTWLSEKVFRNLINQQAENLCEECSLEILNSQIYEESIALKSKNYFHELFKTRKKLGIDHIKNHYPNFYLKVMSIKNIHPDNIFNKINYYVDDLKLSCKTINCKNKVNFNKLNKPNDYCESCSRKKSKIISNNNFMNIYWKEYVKDHFNKVNIELEVNQENIHIKNYCSHHKEIFIKKTQIKKLKRSGIAHLCDDCNREFYKNNVNEKLGIEYLQDHWHTIKTLPYDKLLYYNPNVWATINRHMKQHNTSFSESKYMINYEILEKPKCLMCDKPALFSNEAYAYLVHCEDHLFNYTSSAGEKQIYEFLLAYNIICERNNRSIISTELDIFIPEKNLAIEFNGVYWHSEQFKTKNYHFNKWKECKEKEIKLISVWEDDWNEKQDIVKSIILNQLNLNEHKIGARECIVKLVDSEERKIFLNQNHLQGNCQSSINLGLFYNDELVSLMTFGSKRKITNSKSIENEYELLRFCSKINFQIIGSASKLFNYFIKTYNPTTIISYASCDISSGNLYKTLGFNEIGHTGLNYWWAKDGKKYHRSNFMKHKLVKEGADPNKTEDEIMREKGFSKIWGTGNLKYEINI